MLINYFQYVVVYFLLLFSHLTGQGGAGVDAITVNKTKVSQFPYGKCGLINKNQINQAISPYQFVAWKKTNLSGKNYMVLQFKVKQNPCEGIDNWQCNPAGNGVACKDLCQFTYQNQLDAIHIPLNDSCILNATRPRNSNPCTALVVNNYPNLGLFKSTALAQWSGTSVDLNTCSGTVTQMRFNLKNNPVFIRQSQNTSRDQLLQLAIPMSLFDSKTCQKWEQICQSSNSFSQVSQCAFAPYLNTDYVIKRLAVGGHAFCPTVDANAKNVTDE